MIPVEVRVVDGRVRIKTPYSEENRERCRRVQSAFWNKKLRFDGRSERAGFWDAPATPMVAAEVRSIFAETPLDPRGPYELRADAGFLELAAKAEDAIEARANKEREDLPRIPGHALIHPYTGEPLAYYSPRRDIWAIADGGWEHQRQAYWFAIEQEAAMLQMGMGTGKSKVTVSLGEGSEARRVLIMCPSSVVNVWPSQFNGPLRVPEPQSLYQAHLAMERDDDPPEVEMLELEYGHAERRWRVAALRDGSVKERTNHADREFELAAANYPVAIAINYEASIREPFKSWAKAREWDAVILDESHRIKAAGGVTSRFADSLRPRAQQRFCLTGTAMPHSPLDVYAQYRYLDPGIFGSSNFRFKQRYAIMGGWQAKQVVGYQNQDELSEKFGRIAFICGDEVLDLPASLPPQVRVCTLSKKAYATYLSLKNDFVAWVDEQGATISVNNALTKLLRLQQITSGHTVADDDRKITLGDEKQRLLADVIADLAEDEPLIVYARFLPDIAGIKELAEKQNRRYGECSGADKDGLDENSRMRDDVDLIGVQVQAGGLGIDLSRAAHAYYFSVGFSLGDYLQTRKRYHRPGQTRVSRTYHLIARGPNGEKTVDDTVYAALDAREDVVRAVINAARRRELE